MAIAGAAGALTICSSAEAVDSEWPARSGARLSPMIPPHVLPGGFQSDSCSYGYTPTMSATRRLQSRIARSTPLLAHVATRASWLLACVLCLG